jgi:GDP-D-mannose dehydratase
MEDVLQTLISLASKPVQVSIDKSLIREQEAAEVWGNYSKARLAVGWEPQRGLADTLRQLEVYWEARI